MNTDEDDAHKYNAKIAETLLKRFEEAHGRPARTVLELEEWVGSPEGKAALAYDTKPDGTIIPEK